MKKTVLLIILIVVSVCIASRAHSWGKEEPTAIIIDNATGQPIEGAVALAQWTRWSPIKGAWFEGGSEYLLKAKETFSDKEGKIYIDGYWGWGIYIFDQYPTLTVYKPGYVLWNSKEICPAYDKRTDFDKKNRTVKFLKFDTEAPRWIKEYSNKGGEKPHLMQYSFFGHCYSGEMGIKYKRQIKFEDIFLKYEKHFIDKERMERP